MAKETKFNNMLSNEDEKRSSDRRKVSSEIKREAKKELARREKERKQREKRLKKMGKNKTGLSEPVYTLPDQTKQNNKTDEVQEVIYAKELSQEVAETQVVETSAEPQAAETTKASHIDLDELKKAQEELRKEQGWQEPEIDYSYHKTEDEDSAYSYHDTGEPALRNPATDSELFAPNGVIESEESYDSFGANTPESGYSANAGSYLDEESIDHFEEGKSEHQTYGELDGVNSKASEHSYDFFGNDAETAEETKSDSEESYTFFDEPMSTAESTLTADQREEAWAEEETRTPNHNVNITMADGSSVPSNINLDININIPEGVKSSETVITQDSDFQSSTINMNGEGGDYNQSVSGDEADDAESISSSNNEENQDTFNEAKNPDGEISQAEEDELNRIKNQFLSGDETYEDNDNLDEQGLETQASNEGEDLDADNEHVSKVSQDELDAIKREIAEEKGEVNDEFTGNEHVSKVSKDELEEIKRQLAIERGEIVDEPQPNASGELDDVQAPTAESNESLEEGVNSEESSQESEEENKALEEIKKAASKKNDDLAAPEESLPDNITDQDIAAFEQAQAEEEQRKIEEENQEEFAGMTDEEAAEARERKRRLQELKARYNTKEAAQAGDEGDYRKNLDFSINTSIKRFRVKPPKKPFIIAASIIFFALAVIGVVTYFILNKPPAPIVMSSVSLSQTYTYQYVGDEVDIRGLYADCHYSDGSIKRVKLTESMITRKSPNIDENNIILDYDKLDFELPEATNKSTFVYFTIDGFEARLDIRVTAIEIESISAQMIGQSFEKGSVVAFEDILILGTTTTGETVRIDASTCEFLMGELLIQSNSTGIIIPSDDGYTGEQNITISYSDGSFYVSTIITIVVE